MLYMHCDELNIQIIFNNVFGCLYTVFWREKLTFINYIWLLVIHDLNTVIYGQLHGRELKLIWG
jgi:hypothetical protein